MSQVVILTLLDDRSFQKTAHMSESVHVHNFSLQNQLGLSTKENQLWPILAYSSWLGTNKEKININWKHRVLCFIYCQKKEKETEILCTVYVCFTVCPANNSCQVVIYLLQQNTNFLTVTGNKQQSYNISHVPSMMFMYDIQTFFSVSW